MATTIPTGFHRVKAGEVVTPEKGHFYFYSDLKKLYLATGTTVDDMEVYSSNVDDVRYSASAKRITVTFMDGSANLTIDLSIFAEKTQLGDLSDLATTAKTDLVSAINELYSNILEEQSGSQPLWCGRVSSSGVATRNSGTLSITVNRSNEGVYGIKGAPAGRTVIVSPLHYFVGSVSPVTAPHIAVVSQSSTGILTVRTYALDGTLDDFGFSLLIM